MTEKEAENIRQFIRDFNPNSPNWEEVPSGFLSFDYKILLPFPNLLEKYNQMEALYKKRNIIEQYNRTEPSKTGNYKDLKSFQSAEIVYDFTMQFIKTYRSNMTYKTYEQMEGAARSGKQNIAEGTGFSRTSKSGEIHLINVALASQKELLEDCKDFLRKNDLEIWDKDDPRSREIRVLAYKPNRTYQTYQTYMANPESAANCLICLINQTTFLLDRQLDTLERKRKIGF